MAELLQAAVHAIPTITAGVGNPAPTLVANARARPAQITANARARAALTASARSIAPLGGTVRAKAPLVAAAHSIPTIVASLGGDLMGYLETLALRAERAQRDLITLAAYSTAINVPGTSPVELPTGLVVYPSFRDKGMIEITCSVAHANMNGASLTFALMMGPAGGLANVANWTTPAINVAAGGGNFQIDFSVRIKSQGPGSHGIGGWFSWNDSSGTAPLSPIIGRLTSPNGAYTGFADPTNGDHGDVEIRLDAYLSASGPTLNVRNYLIEQHSPHTLSR